MVARRRYLVLALWAAVLAVAGILYPVLESRLGAPDYTVRNSESAKTQSLLTEHFWDLGAEQDVVVFRSATHTVASPEYRRVVERIIETVKNGSGVTEVESPYADGRGEQISADRRVALAVLGMRGTEAQRAFVAARLQDRIERQSAGTGVEAYLTGPSPLTNDLSDIELRDQRTAENIGIPLALVVLLFALGALAAALLPILVALSSVLLCSALLVPLAFPLHLDRFVTVVATVIGIGVGIDYALFVVSRFREELAARTPFGKRASREAIDTSIGLALRTSGRTVITSGLIVIVALGSMLVINGHIFMEIALATSLVVACCLLTSLVLLPAMLAVLGDRVNFGALPRRMRPPDISGNGTAAVGLWGRWAAFVLRHPVLTGLPALALLILASLPLTSIKLGIDWGLAALSETRSGKGQQIVTQSFTAGAVGPVQVTTCKPRPIAAPELDRVASLTATLARHPHVESVTSVTSELDRAFGGHTEAHLRRAAAVPEARRELNRIVDLDRGGRCTYLSIILNQAVDSPEASALVRDLRDQHAPDAFRGTGAEVHVGGLTAQYVDLSDETSSKLPLVIAIVLGLSFVYLLLVFRSVLIPLKAVVLNILATTAALGLTVFVFQFSHGDWLLGFTSVGTLQAYLPVALFALLFGLSMDYEVFLVSRIQEEYERSGDNDRAVVVALSHTARQITAAAAIMAAVFGSLLLADVLELKQFAFGLAVAVVIDATIVRMLLVPAAMGIAKRANWWIPDFLNRLLPAANWARETESIPAEERTTHV
ncbi:putative drug exporter of the RND superfamily [Sinosporangium album]|uniref:Putative drug exporter of the RND superfamily n=1 Tax=Sinosporangium album TaxID=504805 RepID=A0A1G7SHN1_9ACTN|nr:MMPL family transporter [Sinosporangium album]SDG22503.1 putative drug exporter of the RND superfamily [Sinosporangium album]